MAETAAPDGPTLPSSALRFAAVGALGLCLRAMRETDLPFLQNLYASGRREELAPVSWSEAAKTAFLESQFHAQHAHYQRHYAGAEWLVILRDEEPVGRLYIVHWARAFRIIDIAFLPKHCGRGYGSALVRDLMAEAAAAGKPLSLHVEKNNPALRLYARLGFRPVGEHGVYDLLEWRPA